jgi:hypothetical protein
LTLGSPALEKAIRERIRQELRTSQESWKEYKRMRKADRTPWSIAPWSIVFVRIATAPIFVLVFIINGRTPQHLLLALALYSTAALFFPLFFPFQSLGGRLYRSHDLAVFLHLPIEDQEIFRFEWNKFLRASLWFLYDSFLVYVSFLVFGYRTFAHLRFLGPWATLGFVGVASLLQWLTALSLATLLARYRPSWAREEVGFVVIVLLVMMFFLPRDLIRACQLAFLVVPGGWISYAFGRSVLAPASAPLWVWWLWAAALFVAALLPLAVRELRKTYSTEALTPSRLTAAALAGYGALDLKKGRFTVERGPTPQALVEPLVTAEGVKRPEFFAAVNWEGKGWIERLTARVLRPAERTVAEFMLGGKLGGWSRLWRAAAVTSAVGILATLVLPMVGQGLWVFFVPMIVTAMIAAPLLGGYWPGFWPGSGHQVAGRWAPVYSAVPLGYREISRVMFKVNGVRCVLWLPLLVAYATALAWRLNADPTEGIVLALKAFCLVVVLQPMLVVGHFSQGTNGIWLRRLFFIICVGGILVIPLLYSGVMTFIQIPVITGVGLAIASFSGLSFWLLYGFFYNRGGLDLLRTMTYRDYLIGHIKDRGAIQGDDINRSR